MQTLLSRFPELTSCQDSIVQATNLLIEAFQNNQKLLLCGNGGSACDAEHIVGELMKGFCKKRPICDTLRDRLQDVDPVLGAKLSAQLQLGLPAINLSAHQGVNTAFANDVNADMIFAQQVLGYGRRGDVLMAMSTSGNSQNIQYAATTAKALGMKLIGLTGEKLCAMDGLYDVVIHAPSRETYRIQEYHLPIYHEICLQIENHFFEV